MNTDSGKKRIREYRCKSVAQFLAASLNRRAAMFV